MHLHDHIKPKLSLCGIWSTVHIVVIIDTQKSGTHHEQLKDSSLIYSGAFDVYDFWESNLLANKNVKICVF